MTTTETRLERVIDHDLALILSVNEVRWAWYLRVAPWLHWTHDNDFVDIPLDITEALAILVLGQTKRRTDYVHRRPLKRWLRMRTSTRGT